MESQLNPKLFDIVKFESSLAGEAIAVHTGTIVELLGADAACVEISDENGAAKALISIPLHDVEVVWSGSRASSDERNGNNAGLRFQEGLLLLQNGASSAAKEKFKEAFELDPSLAGTLMNLTNELAGNRAFDTALFVYRLIVDLRPEYELARENLARTHLNRGVEYARLGVLDKALEDFATALFFEVSQEVVDLSRHNLAAAHTQIGLHHIQIKRFPEAFQFFLFALQLEPSTATRRNYALALVSLMAWKRERPIGNLLEDSFSEPTAMGLAYSDCLNAYGATVASLGKTAQAREIIERALAVNPSNELARRNLAILSRREDSGIVPAEMWGLTAVEPQAAGLHI